MSFITVTGADRQTDIEALATLDAEIGLLYSAAPEGCNRYPQRQWMAQVAARLKRVAIHICGRRGKSELISGALEDLVSSAQRIQVNGILSVVDVEHICAKYPHHTIITQCRSGNESLLSVKASNHALLVDASGGRGISPRQWVRPKTDKPVGYAGGLAPENLASELQCIRKIADREWWVDMEGKLRINDWFSVERAREVVRIFHLSRSF